ncbi:sec-independent protein translocase protein TATB, chloroplastic [Rosa chinensis]|uniref:sec-independent protein translocase protein TATB, chloroplastic n=1 Tax=Rosa chinensis TaxID=74649 RepID=UPI000D09007E|nr:sec-independent protein translocase protein TATB, chloroplastic [Rosa chinensis]
MMAMASTTASAATFLCSPRSTKSSIYNPSSSSLISHPKNQRLHLSAVFPQLGLSPFSPWSGLKHLGVSLRPKSSKLGRKGRCKGVVVYASLFGVGAPEALVIGVVALLVFGPKGLAEVARNLGKTLRAFQPTIRELQEVSRDFKSTLEKEIGLDDISSSTINTYNSNKTGTTSVSPSTTSTGDSKTKTDPNGAPSPNRASTTEEYLNITEEQLKASAAQNEGQTSSPVESQSPNRAYTTEEYLKITEEQLKASAAQNQGQTSSPVESQSPPQASEGTVEETAVRTPPPQQSQSES